MTSTLGYALLGLLADGPQTGYDLAQRMARPIGFYWTARHSQIYPELARLETAGLLRHKVIDGAGPLPTKRYRLTKAGRATLDSWIDAPLTPAPGRNELMLRVRLLWRLSPERATAFVLGVRDDHAEDLAVLRHEETTFDPDEVGVGADSPAFSAWATLRYGISYEEHVLSWCDWLLADLGHRPDE